MIFGVTTAIPLKPYIKVQYWEDMVVKWLFVDGVVLVP